MVRRLGNVFIQGLLAVVPLTLTVYLIYWSAVVTERYLRDWVFYLVEPTVYVPGMGIGVGVLIILLAGTLVNAFVIRHLYAAIERSVMSIPLINTLYGSIRDFIRFLTDSREDALGTVVMVEFGSEVRLLGFLTRDCFADCPEGMAGAEDVAVYLPMSYQIGGFTVVVPPDAVTRLDMSFRDAMRFAFTGGIKTTDDVRNEPVEEAAL